MSNQIITIQPGDTITVIAAKSTTQPPTEPPPVDPPPTEPPPGNMPYRIIDLPWDSGAERTYSADHGGFGSNDILAFRFTTPTQVTGGAANISESLFPGHGGRPGSRKAVISLTPGDFDHPITTGMASCISTGNEGTTITFSVGRSIAFVPELQGNTVYYHNLKYLDGADGGNIQIYRGGAPT